MITVMCQDIEAKPHAFTLNGPTDLRIVGLQPNPQSGKLMMTAVFDSTAVLTSQDFLLAAPGVTIPDGSEFQVCFGPFALFKQTAKSLIVT